MAIKGNISNTPNGVIGHIQADINVYHGVETDSAKVTVDNRRKGIKVDVKEEFLDNKQDKLTAGNNITIDENNVISAKGGETYTAGTGIEITSGNVINNTQSHVVANPTIAGTEANLTSLQIGDTKYAIPQGGGSGLNDPFEIADVLDGKHVNVDNLAAFVQGYEVADFYVYDLLTIECVYSFDMDTHEETLTSFTVRIAGNDDLHLSLDTDLPTTLLANKTEIESISLSREDVIRSIYGGSTPVYMQFEYDIHISADEVEPHTIRISNDTFYNLFEE